MEQGCDEDADSFGNAEGRGRDVNVAQTVDYEHAEDGSRQHLGEILDVARCLLAAEDKKWNKAGGEAVAKTRMATVRICSVNVIMPVPPF